MDVVDPSPLPPGGQASQRAIPAAGVCLKRISKRPLPDETARSRCRRCTSFCIKDIDNDAAFDTQCARIIFTSRNNYTSDYDQCCSHALLVICQTDVDCRNSFISCDISLNVFTEELDVHTRQCRQETVPAFDRVKTKTKWGNAGTAER